MLVLLSDTWTPFPAKIEDISELTVNRFAPTEPVTSGCGIRFPLTSKFLDQTRHETIA